MSAPTRSRHSWTAAEIAAEWQYLTSEEQAEIQRLLTCSTEPPSFREFAAGSVRFPLHDWQARYLCPLIQRLADERGVRALIHAPPQFGKSWLIAQRGPAYLLGRDPLHRVGLACYNETHAAGFGAVVRDLMRSPQFLDLFPEAGCRLKRDAAEGEFYTAARRRLNDAQPSFKAMGLLSGFVGRGVDTLVIDDPYRSMDDARSELINEKVWRFWKETAGVRIGSEANVVVMFHRYTEDDLAGRLLQEGGWEYHRFPAIGDANEDGSDPTGRAPGELLSPMRSREWLEAQERLNSLTFLGQFQGRPTTPEGLFFQVGKLSLCSAPPAGARRVRAWDLAGAAPGQGDWTCGVLMSVDPAGYFTVEDVRRGQWPAAERDGTIAGIADADGPEVMTLIEQAPGLAKEPTELLVRRLAGHRVAAETVHRDKVTRAEPFAAQVNAGNVRLAPERHTDRWHRTFTEELRVFPNGRHDDQVDAAAAAFVKLATPLPRMEFF